MKQKKLLVSLFFLLFCGTFVCATKSQAKILTIKHSTKNVYTTKYQREATSYLTKWKKGKRTLDAPLLVKNPYGTLSTSIYFYAVSTEPLYAKYTITAKGAETISGTLAGGSEANVRLTHEYLIPGLASCRKITVEINFYNAANEWKKTVRFSTTPKKEKAIPKIKKVKNGKSKTAVSLGFYDMFGHDKSDATNIYYYDNNGVSRGLTPLNGYRTDRILTVDGNLIFSYDIDKLAVMNRLGHIVRQISLKGYELHHDIMYDAAHKNLQCLVID